MKTLNWILVSVVGGALALGCNGSTTARLNGANDVQNADLPTLPPGTQQPGDGTGGNPGGGGPGPTCDVGQAYHGFGGIDLTSDRVDSPIGVDRGRVKPYSALLGEYPRVLGNTPSILSSMASTFAAPAARWYEEPQGSAITTYSALRIAFQGCLTATASGSTYSSVPTTTTATQQCTTWATNFWSRTPSSNEVTACADYAANQTTSETSPNRRWAYACASVLTSAGFLTY